MSTKPSPTPIPWNVQWFCGLLDEADAELICRAVNNHERLVDVVGALISSSNPEQWARAYSSARAILSELKQEAR